MFPYLHQRYFSWNILVFLDLYTCWFYEGVNGKRRVTLLLSPALLDKTEIQASGFLHVLPATCYFSPWAYFFTLKLEAKCSESSVDVMRTIRRCIPEDRTRHEGIFLRFEIDFKLCHLLLCINFFFQAGHKIFRNMNSLRNNDDCYYYYNSTCLKGDRCMFRHEPSAIGCETVCLFWQRGNCAKQHCNFRHTALGMNRNMSPYYWKKQPGGRRTSHCSSQSQSPGSPPPEHKTRTEESVRQFIPTSTPVKKRKWKKLLKDIESEGVQSESTNSYAHKNKGVKPNTAVSSSTASSGWGSNQEIDLPHKIQSRITYRHSKPDADFRVLTLDEIRRNKRQHKEEYCSAKEEIESVKVNSIRRIPVWALSAKKFKTECVTEDDSVTSGAKFQPTRKSFTSNYNLQESRDVCDDKDKITFNIKVDSARNEDTLTEPVRGGHGPIKTPAQIREEENYLAENTMICSIQEKRSLMSDSLPQKPSCKNKGTGDSLRDVGDGRNLLESGTNPPENDCSDRANEMKSDREHTTGRTQMKRKYKDPVGGPLPKRPRHVAHTADLSKFSEFTVPVTGCLDSTSSVECVFDGKDEDSDLKRIPISPNKEVDMNIDEELLLGDDENDNSVALDTDEDLLLQLD
jgi:hypothetical protein